MLQRAIMPTLQISEQRPVQCLSSCSPGSIDNDSTGLSVHARAARPRPIT